MARTQVQSELLATNSISGTIIADNAITATHIATNAISGTLIQDSGIVTTMIAANNITATKVVTNAIQTRHIADDQVTEDKLANAINTSIAAKLPLAGGTMTGNIVMGDDTSIGIADDAERIEFDGAGDISLLGANVGIGTDSPSNLLHISSSTGDSVEMKITNTNADSIGANIHLEKDSASPADNDFCGEITWVGSNDNNQQPSFGSISVQMTDVSDGTEDGDMIFKTSGGGTFAERWRIGSNGHLKPAVDGYGINFEAAKGAGESSTTLDDYEEGTWTPAVASDASASAYNYRNGYYTKIGRQVRVTCQFRISTIGSFSGAIINLQGLPYTINNLSNYDPIGVIAIKSAGTAKSDLFVRGISNTDRVRIEGNNGNTSSDRNVNANLFDTDTVCFMDFTYFTA